MRRPLPDVLRACQSGQFAGIESKYRNRLLIDGNTPQVLLALYQISSFRKNYLNTISRYQDLPEEVAGCDLPQIMLAQAHLQAGNTDEARSILNETEPQDAEAKMNHLGVLAELSAIEKDLDTLKSLTAELFPKPVLSRHYFRYQSLIYELEGDSSSAELLLRNAMEESLSSDVEATVASLLATKLNRDGHFADAFDFAARSGQALKQKYPIVNQAKLADDIISVCPVSLRPSVCEDQRPTFVIGMPRSGTTLLESIFSAHSQIGAVGESPDPVVMMELAFHRLKCTLPQLYTKLSPSLLLEFGSEQLSRLHVSGAAGDRIVNKALWLDRYVGILAAMFPRAKFIWIHRDPRDNLLSCFLHYIGAPQATTISNLIDARVAHEKLMRHWQRMYPTRIFEISYEDLVANFNDKVNQMLTFLDLPSEESCFQFHQSDRIAMTPSRDQVRKPINSSAISRWKNYEPWLAEVLEAFPSGRVSIPS